MNDMIRAIIRSSIRSRITYFFLAGLCAAPALAADRNPDPNLNPNPVQEAMSAAHPANDPGTPGIPSVGVPELLGGRWDILKSTRPVNRIASRTVSPESIQFEWGGPLSDSHLEQGERGQLG